MIKNISFIVLIFFTTLSCESQTNKGNDLAEKNLNGNVKCIKNNSLKILDEENLKTKEELQNNRFNRRNTVVHYNEDGNINKIQVFRENGNQTRSISNTFKDKLIRQSIDSTFNYSEKVVFWNYKYDENNKLVETKIGNKDGSEFRERAVLKYDMYGNIVKKEQYIRDNTEPNLIFYQKFDNSSNLIENIILEKDSSIFQRHFYKYDSRNRIIEEEHYTHRGMPEYLSNNNIYTYNNNNNVVKELRYNHYTDEMEEWTFKYTYDKSNNWIEKEEYFDDELLFINTREIEYYK